MSVGKQAQILNAAQERAVVAFLSTRRYAARDSAMFLLSIKAGLRAKEIARVTWRKMFQRCWSAMLSGYTRVRAAFNQLE